jgi:hypothetical protein
MTDLVGTAVHFFRTAFRFNRSNPMLDPACPAFEYALIQRPSSRFSARSSQRERWHMFSFDVMVLTLIR